MRTDAEVRERLRRYEKRWKARADKHGGAFWWALKYSAEKEWAD